VLFFSTSLKIIDNSKKRDKDMRYMLTLLKLASSIFILLAMFPALAEQESSKVSWEQVAALPKPAADHRISYGEDEFQFAELRLPEGEGPFPVVVFIHGGCWLSEFDLSMAANLSGALASAGIASWTPEYRRIGNPGGGWPGTLEDLSSSVEYLREIASPHNLDLSRIVLMGHSAGGHLVLWYAARKNLADTSQFYKADALDVQGIVSLAGITDIVKYRDNYDTQDCNTAVPGILGGEPKDVPERVAQINPVDLVPLAVPVRMIHGAADSIVPLAQSTDFMMKARAAGDDVRTIVVDGAGHFDLIAPFSVAWTMVLQEIQSLLEK
jgi:acetyl esterase/lipase